MKTQLDIFSGKELSGFFENFKNLFEINCKGYEDLDNIAELTAKDIMTENPKKIDNDAMAVEALEMMDTHGITQILAEDKGKYSGVVHIHNLTKEGII